MHSIIAKADHLVEALPYIRCFYGKTVVIKYGGAAMTDVARVNQVMQDIALLHFCGMRPVIVHGGGPEISELCERLGMAVRFSNGQRVTDAETMQVVRMVLLGKINFSLVSALNQQGVKAVGVAGQDGGLLRAKKFTSPADGPDASEDLGLVGEIEAVDVTLLTTLVASGFVPVIAPIGMDSNGQAYNINADTVAGAIAGALAAEKLIFLSDVNGLYADINNPETRINAIDMDSIQAGLQSAHFKTGMIPKLTACVQALKQGVSRVHILDGKISHGLLLEIFTHEGMGTVITA
jgi:acetylglutamate kinase